jgi:hypothetical protein
MERGLRRKLPLYEDACNLSQREINKILSATLSDAETGEIIFDMPMAKCPLFDFCNCRTAMCRAVLPDDSCYWYRYFKALIKEREEEI